MLMESMLAVIALIAVGSFATGEAAAHAPDLRRRRGGLPGKAGPVLQPDLHADQPGGIRLCADQPGQCGPHRPSVLPGCSLDASVRMTMEPWRSGHQQILHGADAGSQLPAGQGRLSVHLAAVRLCQPTAERAGPDRLRGVPENAPNAKAGCCGCPWWSCWP